MSNKTKYNLVCFPYAGAGPAIFNTWDELADQFNIVKVLLPGREKKFIETPFRNVQEAVKSLTPEIQAELNNDLPTVVFGHSLGAILAYEFVVHLETSSTADAPVLLVISGSHNPWNNRKERATGLPVDDFIKQITEFAGQSHFTYDDPEMRELLLPVMRADVEMHEDYKPLDNGPLKAKIVTLRGHEDSLISQKDIQKWDEVSTEKVIHREIPGNHMYLMNSEKEILEVITEFLPEDK